MPRHLARAALIAGVAFAVLTLAPTAAHAQSGCADSYAETSGFEVSGSTCGSVPVTGTDEWGEPVTVSCVADGVTVCERTECETVIPDDSVYPGGVTYDPASPSKPPEQFDPDFVDDSSLLTTVVSTAVDVIYDVAVDQIAYPDFGLFSETGRWYRCATVDFTATVDDGGNTVTVDLTDPTTAGAILSGSTYGPVGDTTADPTTLIEQAHAALDIPSPATLTSPPELETFVKIPTWYRLEDGFWQPYTQTATSPGGRVTATITATPVEVIWTTQDGWPADPTHTTTCDHPGIEYTPGTPETAGCGHTYINSSSLGQNNVFEVTTEILFNVEWQVDINPVSTAPGTTTTFGDLGQETLDGETFTIAVKEIQTLVTGSGN